MSIATFSEPLQAEWLEDFGLGPTWTPCSLIGIERHESWGTNWIAIAPDGTGRILPFERVRTMWRWDETLGDWVDLSGPVEEEPEP